MISSHPQVRKIKYNLQNQCSYNIQILKIKILFDLAIKYILNKGYNIIYILFVNLDNIIILIIFNIMIYLSQKMRNDFIIRQS